MTLELSSVFIWESESGSPTLSTLILPLIGNRHKAKGLLLKILHLHLLLALHLHAMHASVLRSCQAKGSEERVVKAEAEIQRLSALLEKESLEKEHVIQTLKTKETEAAKATQRLSDKLEVCKEQVTKSAAELKFQVSLLEEKRYENHELAQKVARKFMEAEDLRGTLVACQDRCGELQSALQTRGLEKEHLRTDLHLKEQELKHTQDELQAITEKLHKSSTRLDQCEAELLSLSSGLKMATSESASRMQQVEQLRMMIADLVERLATSRHQLEILEKEKLAMADSLATTAAQKHEIGSRLEVAMSESDEIQQRFSKLALNLEDEKSTSISLRKRVEVQDIEIQQLEEKDEAAQKQAKALLEEKAALTTELAAKNEEIEAQAAAHAERLSEVNAQVCQLEQKALDLNGTLTGSMSESARLANALEGKAMELENIQAHLSRERERLKAFDRQLSATSSALQDAVFDKGSLILEMEGMHMEREDLLVQLSSARGEAAKLEADLQELTKEAKTAKEAKDSAVQEPWSSVR